MRTRNQAILLCSLGLPLALVVLLLLRALDRPVEAPAGASTASAAAATVDFRWSLPAGTRLVYQLDWTTSQQVRDVAPTAVEGSLALAGRLELRSYGRRGAAWLVQARLTPSAQHLEVLGQDALAVPGALGDATVWVELGDDGAVQALEVNPDAPAIWQNLASALFGALEVVVPEHAGATWEVVQRGPFGRGKAGYTAQHPRQLARMRGTYDQLDGLPPGSAGLVGHPDGAADIRLSRGHLERFDEHEHLVVRNAEGGVRLEGQARLSLALVEVGKFEVDPRVAAAPRTRLAPGAQVSDADGEHQALLARVDGLTATDLMAGVLIQADGAIPDEDRWMWRATGLLRLEPKLCAALAQAFTAGRLERHGRALVLDLLSGAATPEAQAAMRTALASAPAHEDARDWRAYLQRLSFLDRPTAETVAFVRAQQRSARSAGDRHGERAAAYVLGNLAGSLAEVGDQPRAQALASELAAELHAATDPAQRAALLTAYGAAKRRDAAAVVAPYLDDADPEVRRATVDALAEATDAHAQSALLGLAADHDAMVQGAALAALAGRPGSGELLAAVAQIVDGGGLPRVNDLALAAFAVAQHQRGANLTPLTTALATVAARSDDPQVRALIRQALGG